MDDWKVCNVPIAAAWLYWQELRSPDVAVRRHASGFWWGVYMAAGKEIDDARFLGKLAQEIARDTACELGQGL